MGSEVMRQMGRHDGMKSGHTNPTRIVGISNRTRFAIRPSGLPNVQALSKGKDGGFSNLVGNEYKNQRDILNAAVRAGLNGEIIFVDATSDASEGMKDFHELVVDTRNKIVTANKNPIALYSFEDFVRLTGQRSYYKYNASVMAGGDAVPHLRNAYDIGETIKSIEGCFSGTLGFICSELEKGRKFSEIVREALTKGYTEPHPRDDLNGLDVGRKLIILARSAGFPVEFSDIDLSGFIPEEYCKTDNVEEFLTKLEELDGVFEDRMKDALGRNETLRYVARMTNEGGAGKMKVGLENVPKGSELGRLSGPDNLVKIVTDMRGPKIIQEAGAGIVKTAAAVRADLLSFIRDLHSNFENGVTPPRSTEL